MRKRIRSQQPPPASDDVQWLDLVALCEVELTSEDPRFPIEGALSGTLSAGWRASQPGEQTIQLVFDRPQRLTRIRLSFREDTRSREQEFVLSWRGDDTGPLREIVRQQYFFSPPGTNVEEEDYRVELAAVKSLQITIVPDRSDSSAIASLARLQIA